MSNSVASYEPFGTAVVDLCFNDAARCGWRQTIRNIGASLSKACATAFGYKAENSKMFRTDFLPQIQPCNIEQTPNMHEFYIARQNDTGSYDVHRVYDDYVAISIGGHNFTNSELVEENMSKDDFVQFLLEKEQEAYQACAANNISADGNTRPWNHYSALTHP